MKNNFIKCKRCGWTTRKWGHGSNPMKAFRRLADHLVEDHDDYSLGNAMNSEYEAVLLSELENGS